MRRYLAISEDGTTEDITDVAESWLALDPTTFEFDSYCVRQMQRLFERAERVGVPKSLQP
jgi:hypothetical protein